MKHGTFERYLAGCICDRCWRMATHVHNVRGKWSTSKPGPTTPAGAPFARRKHGSRGTYVNGCRCDQCTRASTLYQRGRRNSLAILGSETP